jgi:O-methyltransferase
MKAVLWMVRKIKALYMKMRLHLLFDPLSGPFLTGVYLARMSRFIDRIPKPGFDDFLTLRYDYDRRYGLYGHVIESEGLEAVDYLEFGVSQGHSLRWWLSRLSNPDCRFFGFDTFTGLPEKWGFFDKGKMSVDGGGLSIDDRRCVLVKGLFQETLGGFLKTFDNRARKVIHMDADMYSSTLFVLTSLAPFLKRGDVLIFDEFTVPLHEFKAFSEFLASYYVKVEMIGAVNNYFQSAFKIV